MTYTFVVQARNVINFSEYSTPIDILAAQIPDEPTDLVNVPTVTSATQVGLDWIAPVFDGGSPVIDYRVWYDNASDGATWTVYQDSIVPTEFTVTGLSQGNVYKFKVQSRNLYGYSDLMSNEIAVLAAQIPDVPQAPVTSFDASADTVIVDWIAPDARGSPITSYTIYLREVDGTTYSLELTDCDGTQQAIMDATSCTIPALSLHYSPFLLPWGSSVYAKVMATNAYGSTELSSEGNGAVIFTYPDPPVNLQENLAERSISTLGLTWEDG